MEITRNVRYSLKFITEYKSILLDMLFDEYQIAVNHYINYLWEHPDLKSGDLKKDILNSYDHDWMTQRLKQCACKQALGMTSSARSNKKNKPNFNGKSMMLSSNCVNLEKSNVDTFDFWISLGSISKNGFFESKIEFKLPIKSHKHANQFKTWKKATTFTFSKDGYVSIPHKIKLEKKKKTGDLLGIDLGLNNLFTCSDNSFKAVKSKELVDKVARKKKNSKAHKRAKEELKSYINHCIKKEFDWRNLRLIVTESKIGDIKRNMRVKGRLTKNIRSVISNLPIGWVISRILSECERNRVSFRSVPAYYTSIQCRICGHRNKKNRLSQSLFLCSECGHSEHADINASKNILDRFLFGKYGSEFLTEKS